jgi:hypothetical protein
MRPVLLFAVLGLALAAHLSCRRRSPGQDAPSTTLPRSSADSDVLTFHHRPNRDGFYVDPSLTVAAAGTMHVDRAFSGALPGDVYAQPLYVRDGPGGAGAFYVATESNDVVALDERGETLWTRNLGPPAKQTGNGCGNISPLGVTGTPAIDRDLRLLVLSAATADARGDVATHTIHALSIDDGSERWQLDVSSMKDQLGRSFAPQPQNDRGAVLVVGGIAYVAYGGTAYDCGPFHGWIVGVPLANPGGARAYATKVQGAGFWGCGGPSSDGSAVFAVSGNSTESGADWGGSQGVFRLLPGPTFSGAPADLFVPAQWKSLDRHDLDLGASGLLVVDAPGMTPPALVVVAGKDGQVVLLDRANLGGVGATPVAAERVINGAFIGAGAFATVGGVTYVVLHGYRGATGLACPEGTGGDLVVLRLDPSAANKMRTVWCADSGGLGAPIVTTSDGAANGLAWTVGAEGSGRLRAWELATGRPVFAGGSAADVAPNLHRYATPIAVHGRLYVAGDRRLYAFAP